MRTALSIIFGLPLIAIGYVYPLVVVFRGAAFYRLLFRIWALLAVIAPILTFLAPIAVAGLAPSLSADLPRGFFPEGPFVVAVWALGWLPPLPAGTVALFLREICVVFFPQWMHRISYQYDPIAQQ
jgi:hypothetical protein